MSFRVRTAEERKTHQVEDVWGPGIFTVKRKHPKFILHRSDILTNKQVVIFKELTRKLCQEINEYHLHIAAENDEGKALNKINKLYELTKYVEIVVNILEKISRELFHCRTRMFEADCEQDQIADLIGERVKWLEGRVEKLASENIPEKIIACLKNEDSKSILDESFPFSDEIISFLNQENQESSETQRPASSVFSLGSTKKAPVVPQKSFVLNHPFHKISLSKSNVNFVNLLKHTSTSLPWKCKQDALMGDFDIMRERFLEIDNKIQDFHAKIIEAADASTRFEKNDSSTPTPRHFTRRRRRTRSSARSATASRNISTSHSQRSIAPSFGELPRDCFHNSIAMTATKSSLSAEKLDGDRDVTEDDDEDFTKLSIRKDYSKVYPRVSHTWCAAQPPKVGIDKQIRIVDQGRLKDRTKLRFFNSKRNAKKTDLNRDVVRPPTAPPFITPQLVHQSAFRNSITEDNFNQVHINRLQEVSERLMKSLRKDERIYSARSCASIGRGSPDVASRILNRAFHREVDDHVKYEICKSLLSLGFWNCAVIDELTQRLEQGTELMQIDIMKSIASCASDATNNYGDNDNNVYTSLQRLVEVLHKLLKENIESENAEEITCLSAICLSQITKEDEVIKLVINKLLTIIKTTRNWVHHSLAVEGLVRKLKFMEKVVFHACIRQLYHSIKWKDRLLAAQLIALFSRKQISIISSMDEVFDSLLHKLWDEAKVEVRIAVARIFTVLGLRPRLISELDKQLDAGSSETRAHAVISIASVGIKNDKTLRALIEMLGLDSSDYVRLQVMRTFHALGVSDVRAVRALREREKCDGDLSTEAAKILTSLKKMRAIPSRCSSARTDVS